ncbi:MAG: TetR/AcrR family transcriptional regulator [Ignavibacteria bacterium]|nr:TetR/AcrR family transcriptional regulator [Ignavibacteria bacterium]
MKRKSTKKIILEKALEHFSKQGYAGASIRQIARSVGIRESAIYNHFESKEEIFLALLYQFKSQTISKEILNDELLDQLSNPENFLKVFTRRLIDFWNTPQERKFIRVLLMEQFTKIGSSEISISEYLTDLRSICKLIFGEMSKNGIIKKFDTVVLADEFAAFLFLLRSEKISGDEKLPITKIYDLAEMHVDFFWNSVKA